MRPKIISWKEGSASPGAISKGFTPKIFTRFLKLRGHILGTASPPTYFLRQPRSRGAADLMSSSAKASILWVLVYLLTSRDHFGMVDPLIQAQFLTDITAFLGAHVQRPYEGQTRVEIYWPVDLAFHKHPCPRHIDVRVAWPDEAPLTEALVWRWMRSRRRVTRVQASSFDAARPGVFVVTFNQSLPRGCRTLDEALTWLAQIGVTPDTDHAGFALVPKGLEEHNHRML